MSTRKTIGGALGAIIVLIVAQILAQLVASLFVLLKFRRYMQYYSRNYICWISICFK